MHVLLDIILATAELIPVTGCAHYMYNVRLINVLKYIWNKGVVIESRPVHVLYNPRCVYQCKIDIE